MRNCFTKICFLFLIIAWSAQAYAPLWSILIYTQRDNKDTFAELYENLQLQIGELNAKDSIEIVYFIDEGENSIGLKKNFLLSESMGKYISFMGDGIQVSNNFVQLISEALKSNPDCVSVVSVLQFNSKKLISSINKLTQLPNEAVTYLPLNEMNPIKRVLIDSYRFPDTNKEDSFYWPLKISRSEMLKKEIEVKEPSYILKKELR